MSTSGLMVMARTPEAQRALSLAFSDRLVHKRYVALVAGHMAAPAAPDADGWGVIDLPIAVDWPRRPLRIIDVASGKPSLTRWRIESCATDLSLAIDTTRLLLEPVTGRSHQLRVHLKALGHAIVGDALYASDAVAAASHRLLLHACALSFPHPVSGERMSFTSTAPF
jgi:tRNA pseudouridine32 synthase/23S rRNA pseudouridine746 synthase